MVSLALLSFLFSAPTYAIQVSNVKAKSSAATSSSTSTSSTGADTVVKASCRDPNSKTTAAAFRLCSMVMTGGGSFSGDPVTPGSSDEVPGVYDQTTKRIDLLVNGNHSNIQASSAAASATTASGNTTSTATVLDGLYQGVDPNPLNPASSSTFGPTLCNLQAGKFNKCVSETAQNHFAASCGTHAYIQLSQNGTHVTPIINLDYDKGWGSQENGYLRGTFVAAINFYYKQVMDELKANPNQPQLTMKTIGGVKSACNALASDYNGTQATLSDTLKDLQNSQSLSSQADIGDITKCEKNFATDNQGSAATQGAGSDRQTAQQLCSARSSMEATFVQLVSCEIMSRAQIDYGQKMSTTSQADILNSVANSINAQCFDRCKANSSPNQCANDCYGEHLPAEVLKKVQTFWPSDSSGCSLFPVGLMGLLFLRKDKRRRKKSKAASIIAPLALTCVLLASGCGGSGSNSPTVSTAAGSCPPGVGNAPKTCCNSSGTYIGGTGCPSEVPASGAVSGALSSGALGVSSAATGVSNANKALGTGGATQTGFNPLAQTNAANDGGTTTTGPSGTSTVPALPTINVPTAAQSGDTGTSSSGSKAAASGGSPTGETKTEAAVAAAADAGGTTDPNVKAGGYGGGGGGGGRAPSSDSAAGGLAGLFGSFGAGAAGAGASGNPTDTKFGVQGSKNQIVNGEDPNDYFTRLGLYDNLFKVVERKYTQKAMSWTSGQATELREKSQSFEKPATLKTAN